MTTRRAPKRPPAPAATSVDLTSRAGSSSAAPLPHERDEGLGMTGGVPSARVRQAHCDLQRGVQDTSRAPEAERAYGKLKKK